MSRLEERRLRAKSFPALRDYLVGEMAYRWLAARRHEQRSLYPQLAAPAFDQSSVTLAVYGRIDAEILDWVLSELRPHIAGKTVIDVGANIGNHALAFAEIAEEVFALEPHPRIFQLLALNAQLAPNVVALPVGASDRSATALLATDPVRHGASRISTTPREDEQVNEVRVSRLDELGFSGTREIGLIKIDVEGHEEAVLRGAESLLREHSPIVLFEQNRDVILNGTTPAREFLRTLDYDHFYSLEAHPRWRSPDHLPRLLRLPTRCVEALLFGPPRRRAVCHVVKRLEMRDYPMLIASRGAIPAVA